MASAIDTRTQNRLIEEATKARQASYAPYSSYKVGAAVLAKSGRIHMGCNIENAAFSPTICAERTAIFKAVSEGDRDLVALAVLTRNGSAPCGVCRQVIREFAPNLTIITADLNGRTARHTLPELFPQSFGPGDLTSE